MTKLAIEQCGLSARACNCLFRHGIFDTDALQSVSLSEISTWNKVGEKTLQEIADLMRQLAYGIPPISLQQQQTEQVPENSRQEKVEDSKSGALIRSKIEELAWYSIDEIELSTRAVNALHRAQKSTLKDVLELIKVDFEGVHGLGCKTKAEITENFNDWIDSNHFLETDEPSNFAISLEEIKYFEKIRNAVRTFYPCTVSFLIQSVRKANMYERITVDGYDNISMECFRAILDLPEMQKSIEKLFNKIVPSGAVKVEKLKSEIEQQVPDIPAVVVEDKMLESNIYVEKNGYYFAKRPRVDKYLKTKFEETGERKYKITYEKLSGKKLQEVAEIYDVTRERIRQIVHKVVVSMPLMVEDYYAEAYQYFDLTKSEFVEAFNDAGVIGYEYVSCRYKKGKNTLCNETLQQYEGTFKRELSSYIAFVKNQKEARSVTRESITVRVLIENQDQALSLDDFLMAYNDYITQKNYPAEKFQVKTRALVNFLRGTRHIVFNASNQVRYCTANAETVWKAIDFQHYKDSVISTELLFRDYTELMETQDIRDGYELFYVLKSSKDDACKSSWNNASDKVIFRRVPVIIIGNGDEGRQAIRLLQTISPVSYEDYFAAYEERYGVRRSTAPGNPNITEPLSNFYIDGQYSMDVPAIDMRDVPVLLTELKTKTLWFIDELEDAVAKCCTHTLPEALNVAAMKRIGYILNSCYAFKESYGSMTGYLDAEIFSEAVVDLSILDQRLTALTTFSAILDKKRYDLAYLDVAPKILMRVDEIVYKYNITKEEIKQLQSYAFEFSEEKYFNAHSLNERLRENPIVQKVMNNEWLENCILRSQENVFAIAVTGGYILSKDRTGLRLSSVIVWFTQQYGKMNFPTLVTKFNEFFNINISRYRIAEKLKADNVWDSCVTDMMDTCFDDLIDNLDVGDDELFREEFF